MDLQQQIDTLKRELDTIRDPDIIARLREVLFELRPDLPDGLPMLTPEEILRRSEEAVAEYEETGESITVEELREEMKSWSSSHAGTSSR